MRRTWSAVTIGLALVSLGSASSAGAQRPSCDGVEVPGPGAAARMSRAHAAGRGARDAARELRAALREQPGAPALHVALGDALFLEGDEDHAREAWSMALRIDRYDDDARLRVVGRSRMYGWQIIIADA